MTATKRLIDHFKELEGPPPETPEEPKAPRRRKRLRRRRREEVEERETETWFQNLPEEVKAEFRDKTRAEKRREVEIVVNARWERARTILEGCVLFLCVALGGYLLHDFSWGHLGSALGVGALVGASWYFTNAQELLSPVIAALACGLFELFWVSKGMGHWSLVLIVPWLVSAISSYMGLRRQLRWFE